jgi:hypothetical protein
MGREETDRKLANAYRGIPTKHEISQLDYPYVGRPKVARKLRRMQM